MIEIITHHVEMPPLDDRKYQKIPLDLNGHKWQCRDGEKIISTGNFERISLITHNLNKKHYDNTPK